MTAIKHTLQRDVFLPSDERLISLVHVTKAGKKKKSSFLCAAVTTERQARVYQVKKADKGEIYKKKVSWLLRELKVVDGKDAEKESAEFDLHFEKIYKWVASSVTDKETFITCLWKLSQRYLIQKPDFCHIPAHLLEEVSQVKDKNQTTQRGVDDDSIVDDDYQALSSKEESDLDFMMSECVAAISNADVFAEQLAKQLSVLDGANIHSIMGSEDQVLNLMGLLDRGIDEASAIENKLIAYESQLETVRDQMEIMRDKDTLMTIRSANHQKLLTELDNLVTSLDMDYKYVSTLLDGDLSTPSGIDECTMAAQKLYDCMHADIHPALCKMAAVEEQQKRFSKLMFTFAKRIAHHLNNLFIQQGNELGETLNRGPTDLRLPPHHNSHRELMPYADLMSWLKSADNGIFVELAGVYTKNLRKVYEREMCDFFEMAKQKLVVKGDKSKLSISSHKLISGSSTSLNKSDFFRGRSGSMQSLDSASFSFHGSDTDLAQRQLFDQLFEKVLCELEPVCLAEQDFCARFFNLIDLSTLEKIKEEQNDDEIWVSRRPSTVPMVAASERQMNEDVRRMMTDLFPGLEMELETFIIFADKLDGFNSMYMLVRMGQHVVNTQDTGSFLSMTFASSLVKIKRNFDRFVENQLRWISETKVPKKTRCGIISFVHNFEDFANQAESVFRGTDRRADLDKAYTKLVGMIFQQIVRVANEHPKTPREVVLLENFHHMHAVLSQLKISCLENEKKEAKQMYQDNLRDYTTSYLGRPLEKLHLFFEGIQSRVAAGVKEDEVGYQLAFSKQELRKVIKEYPGKEVKKGLEQLYKKVEKQLCEEQNLLQVVWRTMQEEFIKQYKFFDVYINKCYPDSKITLEFNINEVLQYFSDIARSH